MYLLDFPRSVTVPSVADHGWDSPHVIYDPKDDRGGKGSRWFKILLILIGLTYLLAGITTAMVLNGRGFHGTRWAPAWYHISRKHFKHKVLLALWWIFIVAFWPLLLPLVILVWLLRHLGLCLYASLLSLLPNSRKAEQKAWEAAQDVRSGVEGGVGQGGNFAGNTAGTTRDTLGNTTDAVTSPVGASPVTGNTLGRIAGPVGDDRV